MERGAGQLRRACQLPTPSASEFRNNRTLGLFDPSPNPSRKGESLLRGGDSGGLGEPGKFVLFYSREARTKEKVKRQFCIYNPLENCRRDSSGAAAAAAVGRDLS